jgi:flagellar motility protein MotE (MotC chaperone)
MNILTKPWFAAVLIVFLQPVVCIFLVQKSAPGIIQAIKDQVASIPETIPERQKRPPWDMWTPELDKVTKELKERTSGLREREQAVVLRETRLAAEVEELARTRREIEAKREEISKLLASVDKNEIKNLKSLAQTYSNLSPKAAVAIFGQMDDSTVVKILSQMKTDTIVPIFEEMSKDKSEKNNQAARASALSERLRLLQDTKAAPAGK